MDTNYESAIDRIRSWFKHKCNVKCKSSFIFKLLLHL